jgi:hypothetical protein
MEYIEQCFKQHSGSQVVNNGICRDSYTIEFGWRHVGDRRLYETNNFVRITRVSISPLIKIEVFDSAAKPIGLHYAPRDSSLEYIFESELNLELELLNSVMESGMDYLPRDVFNRILTTFAVDYSPLARYVLPQLPAP